MEESTEGDERPNSHRLYTDPDSPPVESFYPIHQQAKRRRHTRKERHKGRSASGRHSHVTPGLDRYMGSSSLKQDIKKNRASCFFLKPYEKNCSYKLDVDKEELRWSHLLPRRPLAPSLFDYLQPDGAHKFLPRPEWCRAPLCCPEGYTEGMWNGYKGFVNERMSRLNSRNLKCEQTQSDLPLQTVRNMPDLLGAAAPADGLLPEQSFLGGALSQRNFSSQSPSSLFQPDPTFRSNRMFTTRKHDRALFDRIQSLSDESDTHSITNSSGDNIPTSPQLSDSTLMSADADFSASTFGKEQNSALQIAIRDDCTIAAIGLIRHGAPVNYPNLKGVTPIILASQKGNMDIVTELIKNGANPVAASLTGSTALIQASHFGHFDIVHFLLNHGAIADQSNYKSTTALMRSAQEGHENIVQLLLRHDTNVNRENHENMTAVMLAAQRGNTAIVKMLIRAGANTDITTSSQDSTALMLACKRGHVDTTIALISAGSEIMLRDSRERTARDSAFRKDMSDLANLMKPEIQICLMQHNVMVERKYFLLNLWELLHQNRASIRIDSDNNLKKGSIIRQYNYKSIQDLADCIDAPIVKNVNKFQRALIQTMLLPLPLVGLISDYLPKPLLWERRLSMLTKRCHVNPDATIFCSLDLIDEALEEGGFVEACDLSGITPPSNFVSWAKWKTFGLNASYEGLKESANTHRFDSNKAMLSGFVYSKEQECTRVRLRRDAGFLQILAHRSPLLSRTLLNHPYNLPTALSQKLKNNSDVQSLVRRMGSKFVHFEITVAMEILLLSRQVIDWIRSNSHVS